MSADVVQAQYEQLDAVAIRIAAQAQLHAQLHSELKRTLEPLQKGGWQGKGASAFFAEMSEKDLPAVQRLAGALEQGRSVSCTEVAADPDAGVNHTLPYNVSVLRTCFFATISYFSSALTRLS